ncbi:MAG: winged helix-turn-helix domain-containing protein [Actinobacteria bacterium]|nr:winged helix-turn-helix domain-containing protein [Actinomycetota bacterium]
MGSRRGAKGGAVRISILGPVAVLREDGRPVEVGGSRVRTLLARLALAAPAPVTAGALTDTLWPADPPADPANALQSLVSRLRRALGSPSVVLAEPGGYRLAVPAEQLDAHRFAELARTGRGALRAGDAAEAERCLDEALALWRGPAVPELDAADGATLEAQRLEAQRLDALEDRVSARLLLGRPGDVLAECEALAAAHPLRERFTALLMTALQQSGRANEALAAYDRLRRFLRDELGTDPSPALRQQHLELLRAADEPAPTAPRRTNLRAARTSFLGREEQLKRIEELLHGGRLVTVVGPGGAGKTRLAETVAGSWVDRLGDGVWLVELAPVTDPIDMPQAVLGSLGLRASVLVERRDQQPQTSEQRLLDGLADADCLLVLDNCEHLVAAVAELADRLLAGCPRLRILATSREPLGIDGEALCLLTPLELPAAGARLEEAVALPSVRLFLDRAAAVTAFEPDEAAGAAVVEIVRRLDGLPLAIELAAARLRVLPVTEIAARLSDRFRLLTGGNRAALPRHRTLRAVVEWSWELLSPAEQLLAERLAVFPSGATVASALAVCAAPSLPAGLPGEPGDVADLLSQLVDKSLLQAQPGGEVRYRMLETLREYGIERLAERGEADGVRLEHGRYFARLVAEAEPWLTGADQLPWLRRLADERDNVLAALRYLGDAGHAADVVAMARTLGLYWMLLGSHSETGSWLRFALDVPDPAGEVAAQDRAVVEAVHSLQALAGAFGGEQGSDGAGGIEEGLARLRQLDADLERLAVDLDPLVLLLRPMLLFFSGAADRVFELLDRAVLADDPWVRAAAYIFRARVNENEGNVEAMRADIDIAQELFDRLGDRWGLASAVSARAQLHLFDGEISDAIAGYQRAAGYATELGASSDEVLFHLRLSELYTRAGDLEAAGRQADLVTALEFESGSRVQRMLADGVRATVAMLRGDRAGMRRIADRLAADLAAGRPSHPVSGHLEALSRAVLATLLIELDEPGPVAEQLAEAYRLAVATRDLPVLATVGLAVAGWAAAVGDPRGAAQVIGACTALRGAEDHTQPLLRRLLAELRDRLGEDRLAAELAAGRAMDRSAAIIRLDPGRLAAG